MSTIFTKLESKAVARFLYEIIDSDGDFSEEEMQLSALIEAEFNIPMRDTSFLELTESDAYNLIRPMDRVRKDIIFRILDLMVRADGVIAREEIQAMAKICAYADIDIPSR